MPLRLKPHSLTLIEASETVIGNVVETTDHLATPIVVRGQVTPEKKSAVFERFGVEVDEPHQFMFDTSDLEFVKVGNRFQLGARLFVVELKPQIWNAESVTEHAVAILKEL